MSGSGNNLLDIFPNLLNREQFKSDTTLEEENVVPEEEKSKSSC